MNARDRILERLRASTPQLPALDAVRVAAPSPQSAPENVVSRFTHEATALGIECLVEESAAGVHRRVAELIVSKRVLSWNIEQLPYEVGHLLSDATFGGDDRIRQAAADIGITGCDAAIAETASLVLFSAPGRARTVSLLPPVHLALVRRDQIRSTMSEVFQERAAQFRSSASATVITGPSRTADIELTLTLGIHGPGKVIVIIGP